MAPDSIDALALALLSDLNLRLTPDTLLNLVSAVIIIGVAVPTLYMSWRLYFNPLRVVSILLGSFLLLHGFYHLFTVIEAGNPLLGIIGEVVIEPINWALLLAFTIYFVKRY